MLLQFAAITTTRLADLNLGHAYDPVLNDDIDKVIRVCAGISAVTSIKNKILYILLSCSP